MSSNIENPVENPLLKSSVKYYSDMPQPCHVINLICAACEKRSFSIKITGDSFFCFCESCGEVHQLSVYKAAPNTETPVVDLLVKRHQPAVEVVEVAA